MSTRFATHTYHSPDYYLGLIKALVALVKQELSYSAIARVLNEGGFRSPTGKPFNRKIVTNTLTHLRLHQQFRPLIHWAMLQLFFDGRLSREDCLTLTSYRAGAQ